MLQTIPLGIVSSKAAAYLLEQSLLFNPADSAHFSRTPSSTGDVRTWTFSAWVKFASGTNYNMLMGHRRDGGGASTQTQVTRSSSGALMFFNSLSGSIDANLSTEALFRDTSAWYHIVYIVNTTESTDTDRVKIIVNGVQQTIAAGADWPALNATTRFNEASRFMYVGALNDAANNPYLFHGGLMAEVNFVDGTAVAATNFGEEDDDGFWNPIEFTGVIPPDLISAATGTAEDTGTTSFGYAGRVIANAFNDVTVATDANSANTANHTTPAAIGKDWGTATLVTQAKVYGQSGAAGIHGAGTFDLTLEGWDGSSWVELSTLAGLSGSAGQIEVLDYSGGVSYSKHRVLIDEISNSEQTAVAELQFFTEGTSESFGTNGFQLKFADTSAFGDDTSGNTNDYTSNNFTAADQLEDTPTDSSGDGIGNFATWNPNNGGGHTVGVPSEGNLQFTNTASNYKGLVSTIAFPTSGKWGVKFTITGSVSGSNDGDICIVRDQFGSPTAARNRFIATTAANYTTFGLHMNGGDIKYKFNGGSSVVHYNGASSATSDVYEFLFDADNGYFDVKKNGSAFGTQLTGIPTGELYWLCADMYATGILVDFGQQGYVPSESGYSALATQNLPDTHLLYTGTAAQYRAGTQIQSNANLGANTSGSERNTTQRQEIPTSVMADVDANWIRVKFAAHTSEGWGMDQAYVGEKASSGNAWDFDGNQVQLTFNGSVSVVVPAGSTMWSDWVALSTTGSINKIVSCNVTSDTSNDALAREYGAAATGYTRHNKTSSDEAGTTAPTGYTSDSNNLGYVKAIEVQ